MNIQIGDIILFKHWIKEKPLVDRVAEILIRDDISFIVTENGFTITTDNIIGVRE